MFLEAGVKGASSFPAVELSAFGTVNDVYNFVRQAVELFRDVHPVMLELVQMKGMFRILLDYVEWSLELLWLVDTG